MLSFSRPLFSDSWKALLAFSWTPSVCLRCVCMYETPVLFNLSGRRREIAWIGAPQRPSGSQHSQRSKSQPQNRQQQCCLPPGHSFNDSSYSSADQALSLFVSNHCCHHRHHSFWRGREKIHYPLMSSSQPLIPEANTAPFIKALSGWPRGTRRSHFTALVLSCSA